MSKWDLWSSGRTLLRGANISQGHVNLELDGPTFKGPGPVGPPYTQADFDELAARGANYVSISGPGIYSVYPPYELIPELADYYDEVLAMIAQADMFATIGFRTGPGRADWSVCCADEDWAQPWLVDNVWTDRDAQSAWSEMWRTAAAHFGGVHNMVAYKLMVEPNGAAFHLGIYDADEFFSQYAGSTYDWNSFYPDIIDAIREVDTSTPILVSADDYSSIAWLPYVAIVDDGRTAYFVDQYEPHAYSHQDADADIPYPGAFDADFDGELDQVDADWLHAHMSTVADFMAATGRRVTVEEFGVQRWSPGASQYLADEMDLFEELGRNYSIWEWASSWKEYSDSVNAFNYKFGADPANITPVENELLGVLESYWARNTLRPSTVEWTD
jgi:hypothetical protein